MPVDVVHRAPGGDDEGKVLQPDALP